jgi:hypothetical protein
VKPRSARALWAAAILVSGLLFARAGAEAFLRLSDGRVLEGVDVRRDGDLYMLELEGDTVIPIPAMLVAEVGISGKPEPPPPVVPTGLTAAQPQVLAGVEVAPPTPESQTAALGRPAKFQKNVVQGSLGPTYWELDPSEHNFAPSSWQTAPIDSSWTPTDGFDSSPSTMKGTESKWQNSIVDSSWAPSDGFAK